MSRFLPILLVIFCLLQFSCDSGKSISGLVADVHGNPIEDATIKLMVWNQKKDDLPTKIIETVKTDKNGKFKVGIGDEKPETKLVMDVEKEGYKIVVLEFTPLLIEKNAEVFKNYQVRLEKR